MKKRLMVSIMMIALVAALVGGATFALFTDTAVNENNTFAAGTVDINTNPNPVFNVPNMAPGDVVTGTVNVVNAGTLDLKYNFVNAFGGDLAPVLSIVSIKDAAGADVDPAAFRPMASGTSEPLSITVKMDLAAGNWYQAKTGTLTMTFNAEQLANNP